MKVEALADIVDAKQPFRYVKSPVALIGSNTNGTALTGWTGNTGEQTGSMTIGRLHMNRWTSSDMARRSCAINTVTHEMVHLITDGPLYVVYFTDTYAATLTSKAKDGSDIKNPYPVASYLIGTVAQCSWLQEKGYKPEVDLQTCIDVFGHRHKLGDRCDSFSNSQKIEVRNGIPKLVVIDDL